MLMPAAPKICTRCRNTYHAAPTETRQVTTPSNCFTTPRENASPAAKKAMKPTIPMVAHMLEGTFWTVSSTSVGFGMEAEGGARHRNISRRAVSQENGSAQILHPAASHAPHRD
jgi:hypothetical protein